MPISDGPAKLALVKPPDAQFCGELVEKTIAALVLPPAKVPDVIVPETSIAAVALVVVNERPAVVPSFQVTVAVPTRWPDPFGSVRPV